MELIQYNVYAGNYPFDKLLGQVTARDTEEALSEAKRLFAKVDHEDPGMRHPVVEKANGHTLH